ncbi:MAG: hypothetical protein WCI05_18195, partial [Myxococcales bacterium]
MTGRIVVVAALIFSTQAWVQPCLAQDGGEAAARRDLIEAAQKASQAGNHAEALVLARRAGQLKMTTSLRMFLAEEELSSRLFADALGSSKLCLTEAAADVSLSARDVIEERCTKVRDQAKNKVARVVVQVSPANAQVTLSGKELHRALWGTPFPVNPGKVQVEASAPSYQRFRQERNAAEGETLTVEVKLELEPCDEKSERVGERCVPKAPLQCKDGLVLQGDACVAPAPKAPQPTEPAERRGTSWGPWVTVATGAAVAITGGAFMIRASTHASSVKTQCATAEGCAQAWFDSERSSVDQERAFGIGGLVGGGLITAGGGLVVRIESPQCVGYSGTGACEPVGKGVGCRRG